MAEDLQSLCCLHTTSIVSTKVWQDIWVACTKGTQNIKHNNFHSITELTETNKDNDVLPTPCK